MRARNTATGKSGSGIRKPARFAAQNRRPQAPAGSSRLTRRHHAGDEWDGQVDPLWDVKTGRLVRELSGHPHPPQSAMFSSDGRLLVSGADYRTTKVWESRDRRLLATMVTFSESRPALAADDWLAYTPDGFYEGSTGIDRYLAWRVGDDLQAPDSLGQRLHRPDRLAASLKPPLPEPDSR